MKTGGTDKPKKAETSARGPIIILSCETMARWTPSTWSNISWGTKRIPMLNFLREPLLARVYHVNLNL